MTDYYISYTFLSTSSKQQITGEAYFALAELTREAAPPLITPRHRSQPRMPILFSHEFIAATSLAN
jgi:hypothetical protein